MSIRLDRLTKVHRAPGLRTVVADRICAEFPDRSVVALLGRNGAGKTSLLQMIAGTMQATSGQVHRSGTVSWPVGFRGGFHGDLSGAQNLRFVARTYGVPPASLIEFVADFAAIGAHLHQPVRHYSAGMRARLAFGLSMAIRFDTYLVDEVTGVGDAAFRARSEALFLDRLKHSGAIVVSHQLRLLRRICTAGAVLEGGHLHWHEKVEDAIAHHRDLMQPVWRASA
ncbi:MAG: ATP-binding cassette domain-containing protein [Rhodobacteraceae bacterium]|nr:ATP-binding cassette domain-containing protein [Paracoccaceae bacterium]